MKLPKARHRWDLTPQAAIELQSRLADEIIQQPLGMEPRLIAGADASFMPGGEQIVAGWIVWDRITRRVVDQVFVVEPVPFPYVPGLLSFREAPALLAAAQKLKTEPDVFMIDGQGRAHPRRMGIAAHVGLFLDRPTLGCGKSRLCGTHSEPGLKPGDSVELMDQHECIGRVVRTREKVKPVYISVGHRMTLEDAVRLTLECCAGYRLPEPTRLAHNFVGEAKTLHGASGSGSDASVGAPGLFEFLR